MLPCSNILCNTQVTPEEIAAAVASVVKANENQLLTER